MSLGLGSNGEAMLCGGYVANKNTEIPAFFMRIGQFDASAN